MKAVPRPVSARALRSALDMFLCLPPRWVPSTLTGSLPGPLSSSLSSNAWRMRCRMYRAAGGETQITQYSCRLPIALPVGDVQVDGVHPLAERQLRVFQPRARLDGEVGPAVGAPVRHRGVAGFPGVGAPAVAPGAPVEPEPGPRTPSGPALRPGTCRPAIPLLGVRWRQGGGCGGTSLPVGRGPRAGVWPGRTGAGATRGWSCTATTVGRRPPPCEWPL